VERALLVHLPEQLSSRLDGLTSDQVIPEGLERIFPHAHALNDSAEARYVDSHRDDLISARQESLEIIAKTASADHISDDEADAWLGSINVLRLTIGTRLGVSEEPKEVLESDPGYADWVCYQYLSYLESEIVDAMTEALPPPIPGAGEELPDDPWGDPLGGLRWDGTPTPERPQEQ
jgi:hypothetical protein